MANNCKNNRDRIELGATEPAVGETVKLYRAVGPGQLDAIEKSNWTAFPHRLSGQKFFYPQLNIDFARWTAGMWNAGRSGVGFVVSFNVKRSFLAHFQAFSLGGDFYREYRIPAAELVELNRSLVGPIELVEEVHQESVRNETAMGEPKSSSVNSAVGFSSAVGL